MRRDQKAVYCKGEGIRLSVLMGRVVVVVVLMVRIFVVVVGQPPPGRDYMLFLHLALFETVARQAAVYVLRRLSSGNA